MVLRTIKRGANAGNKIWGCSGFPKSRYIKQTVSESKNEKTTVFVEQAASDRRANRH